MSLSNHILNSDKIQGLKESQLKESNEKRKEEDTYYVEYASILKRLNLQSIGYYIREGSKLLSVDETSFSKREQIAESELDRKLHIRLEEETIQWLWTAIMEYTAKKEEVQFSQGMKAGAKLALLLTSDSEYDF